MTRRANPAFCLVLLLLARPTHAAPPPATPPTPPPATPAPAAVPVRAGVHGETTRLVYVLPDGVSFTSLQLANLLVLTFPNAGQVAGFAQALPHVLSVSGGVNQAAIGLAKGVKTHIWRLDKRVIVDVSAPAPPAPPPPEPPLAPPPPPVLPPPVPPPATPR
jgi:hypothetical protein